MRAEDVIVEVRSGDMKRQGQILPEDLSIQAALQFNNVGTWDLSLGVNHPLAPVLRGPGSGILCWVRGTLLFSGPMTSWRMQQDQDNPGGLLSVSGLTDECILNDRLVLPDPTDWDGDDQVNSHDVRTGSVEDRIRGYVNAHAGPGADGPRKTPHFVLQDTNLSRGDSGTTKSRYDSLGSLVASLAQTADLGVRVLQRGDNRVLEIYDVADRSDVIRLDMRNGTLDAQSTGLDAPTGTEIIVAGQGDLTDRQFYLGTNEAAQDAESVWGRRIERFIDQRQTDDDDEHVARANEELDRGGKTVVSASLVPAVGKTMQFGRDWNMGDQIAAVLDNTEYVATVSGVAFSVNEDGVSIVAVLGDPTAYSPNSSAAKRLAWLNSRLALIEASK